MKLCFFTSTNSVHEQRWISYFKKKHEVTVITYDPEKIECANILQLPSHARFRPFNKLLPFVHFHRIAQFIKETNPDIVHGFYLTSYGFRALLFGFHPVVTTAMGSDVYLGVNASALIERALLKYAIRKSDMITVDAEDLRKRLVEIGAEEDKIVYIPMGVDVDKYKRQHRSGTLMEKLGIRSNDEVVISTRHLSPIYNVECLIKAAPLVLRKRPNVKFIIVGNHGTHSLRTNLKLMAEALNIGESIRFIGEVRHEQIPSYLNMADVYVSTSLSDSTSVALLEAMACELPVIATDLEGNKEWIKNNENGLIFQKKNFKELAEKIVYLLEREDLRRKMGRKSRKLILKKACWKKNMEEMERAYHNLVNSCDRERNWRKTETQLTTGT